MGTRQQLRDYVLKGMESGSVFLKVDNGEVYGPMIDRVFPDLRHGPWRRASYGAWSTEVSEIGEDEFLALDSYLALLEYVITLRPSRHIKPHFENELDQALALSYTFEEGNIEERTAVHQLVYQAKYDRAARKRDKADAARRLATQLAGVIRVDPLMANADAIASVPWFGIWGFHLATEVAGMVCEALDKRPVRVIRKVKKTRQLKELALSEKREELADAFVATPATAGKTVLLIDDIYESGTTMWTVARALKQGGARAVYGLACVKTWRDTDNL